jgi:hypothetical protein
MRVLGMCLLIVGCIGGCASCEMDTTFETSRGERMHSIGLASQRQTSMIASGAAAVVGVLLYGFGELLYQRQHHGPRCPQCNGPLDDEPKVCRHCRIELRWTKKGNPLTVERFEEYRQALEDAEEAKAVAQHHRAQIAAERREEMRLAGRSAGQALVALLNSIGNLAVSVPLAVDGALKKAAGDGNEIIYRFFQALVYVAVPAGIAAAVFLIR